MEKNYEENDCYEEKNQEVENQEDKLLIQKKENLCVLPGGGILPVSWI